MWSGAGCGGARCGGARRGNPWRGSTWRGTTRDASCRDGHAAEQCTLTDGLDCRPPWDAVRAEKRCQGDPRVPMAWIECEGPSECGLGRQAATRTQHEEPMKQMCRRRARLLGELLKRNECRADRR